MFLRQLEYLTALARERHFGRAAEACHVSQPALSAGVRKLERELGIPLVQRQQRYDDLTPEGRALLGWAQQGVAGVDGLTAEAARLREGLAGTLRLGVIPTALNVVSLITGPLLEGHPGVRAEIRSLSSIEIGMRLAKPRPRRRRHVPRQRAARRGLGHAYLPRALPLPDPERGTRGTNDCVVAAQGRPALPAHARYAEPAHRRDGATPRGGSTRRRGWRRTRSRRCSPSRVPAGPACWRTPGWRFRACRRECAPSS